MTILYLLIPLSLLFLALAIWALVWSIKNGQYDDLEGPAHRILMDDDDPRIPTARRSAPPTSSASAAKHESVRESSAGDGTQH